MTADPFDPDDAFFIVDGNDEPVVIALDVENDTVCRDDARSPVEPFDFNWARPTRPFHFVEPYVERSSYRLLIPVALQRLHEVPEGTPGDDPHLGTLACTQNGRKSLVSGTRPSSTYWLVSDDEVVGVSNLRHKLTDALRREGGNIGYGVRPTARRRGFASELLKRTLARARALGLSEVLITCAKANVASARTILGGGGVLTSEEFLP